MEVPNGAAASHLRAAQSRLCSFFETGIPPSPSSSPTNNQWLSAQSLLHAPPRTDSFYVLDRATGELLSAKPYTAVSWATGIDLKSGRPIENPQARYAGGKGAPVAPGPSGGHTWHSMSFSPLTKLVYVPVQDAGFLYKSEEHFQQKALGFNVGIDFAAAGCRSSRRSRKLSSTPLKAIFPLGSRAAKRNLACRSSNRRQRRKHSAPRESSSSKAPLREISKPIAPTTVKRLWSADAQSGVVAAPMTYTVNGEQYVAVLAGWGGVFALAGGEVALSSGRTQNISRLLAFRLNSKASLPPLPQFTPPQLKPPKSTASIPTVKNGEALFQRFCSPCHGDVAVSGGVLPISATRPRSTTISGLK